MPEPGAVVERVRVFMLVRNSCTHDARVLKEAEALGRRGYRTTIVAVQRDGAAAFEDRGIFTILRVPIAPLHYRFLRRLRTIPRWQTLMARASRRRRIWRVSMRRSSTLRRRARRLAKAQRKRDRTLEGRTRVVSLTAGERRGMELSARRGDRYASVAGGVASRMTTFRRRDGGFLSARPAARVLWLNLVLRAQIGAGAGRALMSTGGRALVLAGPGRSGGSGARTRAAVRVASLRAGVSSQRTVISRRLRPADPDDDRGTMKRLAAWPSRSLLPGFKAFLSTLTVVAGPVRRGAFVAFRVIARPVSLARSAIRPAVYESLKWTLMKFHRQFLLFDYTRRALEVIDEDLGRASARGEAGPVVIHAHDLNTLFAGTRGKRMLNCKLVYDSHELQLGTTGMMARSRPHRWLYRVYERTCAQRADGVITVCASIADILERSYGIQKVDVVRNCPKLSPALQPHDLFRREFGIAPDQRVALYHGNLAPMRGLEVLVESALYLDGISVVFLGGGPLFDALGDLADELGVRDRVHLHRPVGQHVLPRYVASADVAVVPIQGHIPNYYYSLPNKLFESFMAGLPIAASNLPEISRLVEEERVGAIFDPDDPRDMARAITEVLSSPDYDQMRRRAAAAARERHHWGREVERLGALYERILV